MKFHTEPPDADITIEGKLAHSGTPWATELPGGCIFLAASVELDDKPGPVRDVLEASQRDWLGSWATAVRLAVDEGHLRPGLDVDQLAHQIVTLGYGHHVLARLLRAEDAEARSRAAFDQLLDAARPTGR